MWNFKLHNFYSTKKIGYTCWNLSCHKCSVSTIVLKTTLAYSDGKYFMPYFLWIAPATSFQNCFSELSQRKVVKTLDLFNVKFWSYMFSVSLYGQLSIWYKPTPALFFSRRSGRTFLFFTFHFKCVCRVLHFLV